MSDESGSDSELPVFEPDDLATPDQSGKTLGDFHVLHRLGRGGMADVYLAEQASLGRRVALKILRPHLAKNQSYVRRFVNEARAAASLIHTNIVQVFEVGVAEGLHYIAQEYVSGQNLRQWLSRSGPLSAALAVNIMRQVAAGLHCAGRQGIVHRDIKPENIMLARTGEVKVADFGLARFSNNDVQTQLTQIGMTMGTPLYMSPEQVEGKQVDARSDLYSFGVTCYHMVAGRPPFEGDTPISVAIQHVRSEPARLEQIRPDLPEGLCRIIHKLLAKKPADRYQAAADLLRDLRELPVASGDESWTADGDELVTQEMLDANSARILATRRLASLMRTESKLLAGGRRWLLWTCGVVAGAIFGIGAAYALRPAPMLESRGGRPEIEQRVSAQEQYLLAMSLGTERGFRSVEEFFPREENADNLYYARLAQQRLAEFYLEKQNYADALIEYTELGRDPSTRIVGLIGLANTYHRRDKSDPAWRSAVVDLQKLVTQSDVEAHVMALGGLDGEPRELYAELHRSASPTSQGS